MTRSGLLRLDRIQPLQEVLPQNVSNKLKFAISDGMNLSPLPKVTPYKWTYICICVILKLKFVSLVVP